MTDHFESTNTEPQRYSRSRCSIMVAVMLCAGMLSATMAAGCAQVGANAGSGSSAAPEILGITVAPERLLPGDRCELMCEIAPADGGHTFVYTWTASRGEIVGDGPTAIWVTPDTEGLSRIAVRVDDGRGGASDYAISLAVKQNSAPEFQSVPSFAQGVRPGASVSLACPAVDAEGDEVAYEWQAAFGEIRGEGDTVTWVAPTSLGSYVVTVLARDAYGGEARRDILIGVTPSLTPKLGPFEVEAIGHDMLKYELGVWDIYIGEACRLECVVLEGDGPFTYAWTADEGILTADGAAATWQAPDVRGPATIKVDVTDALGNTNSGQLLMFAEDCTCAFN